MQRWEYLTVKVDNIQGFSWVRTSNGHDYRPKTLDQVLSLLGKQGWEAISHTIGTDGPDSQVVIMKRPKS